MILNFKSTLQKTFSFIRSSKISGTERGFTLIDVLIGVVLTLIIFFGIFGAFQLGLKVIDQSKNRIIATAITNQQIEMIRNLSYGVIGIKGGFPDGTLEAVATTISNNIEYTIETRVDYVVDDADGLAAPEDGCPNDYKRAEVKVSWSGRFGGEVVFVTDVAPKNLAQECADEGGILSVLVFDAYGIMVEFPLIEVKNPETDETLKTATPDDGQHYFSLATSTYKVVISKTGFSTERTYGTDEITTPEKPHTIILDGQLTEISFSIDEVSIFSVDTLSPWGTDDFSDSFDDTSKISESSDVIISGGEISLASSSGSYLPSGYLISATTSPGDLMSWNEFSWTDSEPLNTNLSYQIYYASGTDWYLIPDSDLLGNSGGFDDSPVDLSNLSTTTYSQLKLRTNFSTSDLNISPILKDWQLSWITSGTTSIQNVTFLLQGEKVIGTDAGDDPVYKYSVTSTSDSSGHINISNLEWDSYTFSVDPADGLDLKNTDPSPQPIDLLPDNVTQPVTLYLEAENSLLLTVKNIDTLEPVFAATTTLYNVGLSYDTTQYTNNKGQAYFAPLEVADYDLEIEAPGYLATSTTVVISGDVVETTLLEQIE